MCVNEESTTAPVMYTALASILCHLKLAVLTATYLIVMVDNGLLRDNEAEDVRKTLTEHFGVNLTVVNAADRFLRDLKGVTDPEQKRKIIGKFDIGTFEVGYILIQCRPRFHRSVQAESEGNRGSCKRLVERRGY